MDDSIYNPFSGDEEILFKDKDGQLKVLKGGKVVTQERAKPQMPKESPKDIEKEMVSILGSEGAEKDLDFVRVLKNTKVVDKIVEDSHLTLGDDTLKRRFRYIIISRLKDVRDKIETREILVKPVGSGGLGLKEKQADEVVEVIELHFQRINDTMRELISKKVQELQINIDRMFQPHSFTPEIEYKEEQKEEQEEDISLDEILEEKSPLPESLKDGSQEDAVKKEKEVLSSKTKVPKPSLAELETQYLEQLIEEKKPYFKVDVPSESPAPEIKPLQDIPQAKEVLAIEPVVLDIPRPPPLQKTSIPEMAEGIPKLPADPKIDMPFSPQVESVKIRPKLVGPAEELQYITLEDFRRFDTNPYQATIKLMEKIQLLEKESFTKKYEGMKAWRKSEVFKVYTQMGTESMENKIPVPDVISKRIAEKRPTLTYDEFVAIMDFNEQLRH